MLEKWPEEGKTLRSETNLWAYQLRFCRQRRMNCKIFIVKKNMRSSLYEYQITRNQKSSWSCFIIFHALLVLKSCNRFFGHTGEITYSRIFIFFKFLAVPNSTHNGRGPWCALKLATGPEIKYIITWLHNYYSNILIKEKRLPPGCWQW